MPVSYRQPAWIWTPESERKLFVTLWDTTERRISRSEMLLVSGTSRLVRKVKSLPRHGRLWHGRLLQLSVNVRAWHRKAQVRTNSALQAVP